MIKNEREYRITKASARKLEDALENIDELRRKGKHDAAKLRIQTAATESMLADLRDQITEYEQLKKGKFKAATLELVEAVPSNLIRARIALGWTQKDLADKLGTTEQQIQKYEATDYESASFKRVMEIATVLKEAQTPGSKRRNA
jgi:ribosome-binding protein aMBF1 (putative translation factor)